MNVLFRMTVKGSLVILFILVVRYLMRRASKRRICMLWNVAALALLNPGIPVKLPARLSYLWVGSETMPLGRSVLENRVTLYSVLYADKVLPAVWIGGFTVLLIWCVFRVIQMGILVSRHRDAVEKQINSAFVQGVLHTQVVVSSALTERQKHYVLLHEQEHIRRRDSLRKFIAEICCWVHWFNPLVWYAARLYAEDLEMSCDEAVTTGMTNEEKAEYAGVLVDLSQVDQRYPAVSFSASQKEIRHRVDHVFRVSSEQKTMRILCTAAMLLLFAGALVRPIVYCMIRETDRAPLKWCPPVTGVNVSMPFGGYEDHFGTDYASSEGDDVFACADGTVIETGTDDEYGNYVIVEHGNLYYSMYANLGTISAETGKEVNAGDRIAQIGISGYSTGPHLHFTIRRLADSSALLEHMTAIYPEDLIVLLEPD